MLPRSNSNSNLIIFDKIWYKITSNNSTNEYINGSNLINFVKEMVKLNNDEYITKEQIESVNNFSDRNPDTKIYKINIDNFLNNLLGFTFNEYIEMIKLHDDKKIEEDYNDYKAKYYTLKKEYEYYKNKQLLQDKDKDNIINYDVIINEFSHQIKEQRELMLNISHKIENTLDSDIPSVNKRCEDKVITSNGEYQFIKRFIYQVVKIGSVILIASMIYFIISKYTLQYDEFGLDNNNNNNMYIDKEPWWSEYNNLSEWIYKLQDWFADWKINQYEEDNKIFDKISHDGIVDPFNEIKY